jgi:hypothetical protein
MKTRFVILILSLVSMAAPWKTVAAATQTITASIKFETALTLLNKTDISFGYAQASQPGVYTISPSGALTTANNGVWLGGDTHAGSMTIAGSTTQAINIAVNNYVPSNGVTPSAATCSYNGSSSAPCSLSSQSAPGTGKPLLIGVTLSVDGTQQIGTSATPAFDIVVTYD